jgi:hypothetical protein
MDLAIGCVRVIMHVDFNVANVTQEALDTPYDESSMV